MASTRSLVRPRIGDTCWIVEWCSKLAFYDDDPTGDVDRDNCTMTTRRVATQEEAERLAREVYPITTKTFGVVEYWPAEFVCYAEEDADLYPYVGHWQETADSEFYEGDD